MAVFTHRVLKHPGGAGFSKKEHSKLPKKTQEDGISAWKTAHIARADISAGANTKSGIINFDDLKLHFAPLNGAAKPYGVDLESFVCPGHEHDPGFFQSIFWDVANFIHRGLRPEPGDKYYCERLDPWPKDPCGFYAVKSLHDFPDVQSAWGLHTRFFSIKRPVLNVELFGTVIEYQKAYRAEYQRVMKVFLPQCMVCPDPAENLVFAIPRKDLIVKKSDEERFFSHLMATLLSTVYVGKNLCSQCTKHEQRRVERNKALSSIESQLADHLLVLSASDIASGLHTEVGSFDDLVRIYQNV